MKIGLLGLGKMGEALAKGFASRKDEIGATRRGKIPKDKKLKTFSANTELTSWSDVLIICVKPHQVQSVLKEIRSALKPKTLLICIAASITLEQLREWAGKDKKIIRAMPNLPAVVGEAMTVLASDLSAESKEMKTAQELFESIGKVSVLDEGLLDGVTGLSACGPAFIFLIIEALSEAGVKVGIPRDTSVLLATQTMLGSSKMVLETGLHPAALKDQVTTPAGCTVDGLMALEEGAMRATLIRAIVAATEKSATLRKS